MGKTDSMVEALTQIVPLARGMYEVDGNPVAKVILDLARAALTEKHDTAAE